MTTEVRTAICLMLLSGAIWVMANEMDKQRRRLTVIEAAVSETSWKLLADAAAKKQPCDGCKDKETNGKAPARMRATKR